MNFNLIGVVSLSMGIILIYAAIKKQDPRQVIKEALQGKGKVPAKSPATEGQATPEAVNAGAVTAGTRGN